MRQNGDRERQIQGYDILKLLTEIHRSKSNTKHVRTVRERKLQGYDVLKLLLETDRSSHDRNR